MFPAGALAHTGCALGFPCSPILPSAPAVREWGWSFDIVGFPRDTQWGLKIEKGVAKCPDFSLKRRAGSDDQQGC